MYNRNIVFVASCLGILLFGIGILTLGSLASELKTKYNLDELEAGTLFSILPIGILAGSLFFGPICDRYGYKILMIFNCILMFAGFMGLAYASSTDQLKIFIFLFGAGGGSIN